MSRLNLAKLLNRQYLTPLNSLYQKLERLMGDAQAYYRQTDQKTSGAFQGSFFEVAPKIAHRHGLKSIKVGPKAMPVKRPLASLVQKNGSEIDLFLPHHKQAPHQRILLWLFPINVPQKNYHPVSAVFFLALTLALFGSFLLRVLGALFAQGEPLPLYSWLWATLLTLSLVIIGTFLAQISFTNTLLLTDLLALYRQFFQSANPTKNPLKIVKKSRQAIVDQIQSIGAIVLSLALLILSFLLLRQSAVVVAAYFIFIIVLQWGIKYQNQKLKSHHRALENTLGESLGFSLAVFGRLSSLHLTRHFGKDLFSNSRRLSELHQKLWGFRALKKLLELFSLVILAFGLMIDAMLFPSAFSFLHSALFLLLGLGLKETGVMLVNSFKKSKRLPSPTSPAVFDKVEPVELKGGLELVDVSFRYPSSSELVFNRVRIDIKPNNLVGIFGVSGSGKSTLISIMNTSLSTTDGQLLFDGQDARSLNEQSLRHSFGIVAPYSRLMPGTILENILVARPFSHKDVEKLFSYRLFWPLLDLPMGLNTYILWHGTNILPPQRMLILLARALLHRPNILFMDEAYFGTSMVEEEETIALIKELPLTKVIASHRLELARLFDQAFIINQGRVNPL